MPFNKLIDVMKSLHSRYPAFSRRMKEVEALARWTEAVGPTIAKHTRAIRVQDGVLWIEVDHPIWKTELHHRKRQILQALNQRAGDGAPLTDLFLVDARFARSSTLE